MQKATIRSRVDRIPPIALPRFFLRKKQANNCLASYFRNCKFSITLGPEPFKIFTSRGNHIPSFYSILTCRHSRLENGDILYRKDFWKALFPSFTHASRDLLEYEKCQKTIMPVLTLFLWEAEEVVAAEKKGTYTNVQIL